MFNWTELVGDGYECLPNGIQKIVVESDEYIVRAEKTLKENNWWLSSDYKDCHWSPHYHRVSNSILWLFLKRFMVHHDLIDKGTIAPIDWVSLVGNSFEDYFDLDNRHEIDIYFGDVHVKAEYGNNCLWYVSAHTDDDSYTIDCFSGYMTDDEFYQYICEKKGNPVKNILLASMVEYYVSSDNYEHFSHETLTHLMTGYKNSGGWTFISCHLATKAFTLLEHLADEEVLKQIELITK